MDNQRREIKVELSRGEDDWKCARECIVRAFHRYPLYTYLIQNESIRPEFLKRYLNAIYDVTVTKGNSLLLTCVLYNSNQDEKRKTRKIIGGALIVPASENGGWEYSNDEDFAFAYKKHGLRELDSEAMDRIERYEEWEYEHITKVVSKSKIPMWNGLYCAIDPEFAGQGCGTFSYAECIRILQQAERRIYASSKKFQNTKCQSKDYSKYDNNNSSKILPRLSSRFLRVFSRKRSEETLSKTPISKTLETSTSPIAIVLSHSEKAVRFHMKNGFRLAEKLVYNNLETGEESPFTVCALVMDFGHTARIDELGAELKKCANKELDIIKSNRESIAVEILT